MAQRRRLNAVANIVQLTPPGRGAVATLRVEGPRAAELVAGRFHAANGRPLASFAADRPVFGHFSLTAPTPSETSPSPGEEVIVRRLADDAVELHCHGGTAAAAMIQQAMIELGCRPATWQEWIAGHEPDPIAAASRIALADARTERTASILLDQYHGALRRAIEAIRQALSAADVASARAQLGDLLARASVGRHLTAPWRVVLAGQPNVGKSSLINALVGYQRAIVHPTPGTTRDVVTAVTAIDGWPVELCDTAGLRASDHPVERAGVELARGQLQSADLVLLVFDASRPWSPADQLQLDERPDALAVHNKSDLGCVTEPPRPPGILASALAGKGIDRLLGRIAARLVPTPPPTGAAVPFTAEQIQRLQVVLAAVDRGDIPLAEDALRSSLKTK